jgi:hypothetical protein
MKKRRERVEEVYLRTTRRGEKRERETAARRRTYNNF